MPNLPSTPPQRLVGRGGHNAARKFPAEPLTHDEITVLLAKLNGGPTGDRARALVAVLYRAGLRIGEALALRVSDVNMKGTIRVRHGKGDRARTVGIDAGGLLYVQRWIDRRAAHGLPANGLLFTKLNGEPWTRQAASEALALAARKAGIDKRVNPHAFRHTHAFKLALSSVPVGHIQRQLGHASLATTDAYLNHLNPAEVVAAVQAVDFDS